MSSRSRLSLDGEWNFSTNAGKTFTSVNVPSPWQADARFRDHVGMAWYEHEFNIPIDWLKADRVIILGFGAVDYFAKVWLNEIRIGEHEGGYLPFEFDITKAARAGTNTLTVRVDDPLEIFSEIPHGKQSWYGMLSGIWQSVWVESRPATHIQRVKISTDGGQVSVDVNLRGEFSGGLTAQVLAPDGEVVARIQANAPRFSLHLDRPLAWSPEQPNLYRLKLNLSGLDEVTETFGFRTLETRDGKILLNGRPFYLRGALDQDYYPDLVATPPSQEYIEDEFRKAKEMGLNCLRVHIKVADPRYYAAADKVGLLVWTELPNHILLSEDAKRRARETIAGMVERDWNHPSIGIWTIINESWGIDLTDVAQRAWLMETYDWLKRLDPGRLVVDNSACWGNFHEVTDIADFHIYYAMPDHLEQWREWMEDYADRPWWLFAHEYQDHATWRQFLRDPWHMPQMPVANDVRLWGDEPLLVSEFGNWGLPDVTKLYAANQNQVPWWFDTGLEWGEGVVYPHGIEQRFRAYHLDRVFDSLSTLAEASQHLQFDALKYEIEQIRRYESIQGYIITEFTDVHWECNGLLDMFRNPKSYYPRLSQINADDLLIPLWDRLVFSEGDLCKMRIVFSHYANTEIQGAVIRWEAVADQLPLIQGEMAVSQLMAFDVTDLGVLSFTIPRVDRPTRASLEIRLLHGDDLVASTQQDIYIYPPPSSYASPIRVFAPDLGAALKRLGYEVMDDVSRADVAVVTQMNDAWRDFLLRGGRAIFLAEEADALQTYVPGIGIQSRVGTAWQGDWAGSFGWHAFDRLPTKGVVNFAFADLTPEHVIHGFAPRDFAIDVFAGLFVGWLHKPIPTIARRRVGRGQLLISTFRLRRNLESNPLATSLLAELLQRVA